MSKNQSAKKKPKIRVVVSDNIKRESTFIDIDGKVIAEGETSSAAIAKQLYGKR